MCFNFLISIQLPLKRAHIEVSMLKLNKVYIYIGKKLKDPRLIYESPLSPQPIELEQSSFQQIKEKGFNINVLTLELLI